MSLIEKITAQLPFGKKSETAEYFFVLNIGLSEVTAAVWAIYTNELEILSQFTSSYNGTDDLIDKAYQALDKSLGALEIEPKKILFGVPETWSLDDDLKEPYLKLLRKMLKEFGLEPLAYVTTTNALSFFLQKQEGAPQTAILIGVGEFLELTLTKGGKVLQTRAVKRSSQLFEDIEKTLGQFTEVEVLPSKIFLYSSKHRENLAKIKDEMMSYPWMQRLSFLHFPKIEILNDDIAVQSVILSAASEMNPHINFKHNFTLTPINIPRSRPLDKEDGPTISHARHLGGAMPMAHDKTLKDEDGLGFVEGDIKERLNPQELDIDQEEDVKNSVYTPREIEDLEGDNLVSPDLSESAYEPSPRFKEGDFEFLSKDNETGPEEEEMLEPMENRTINHSTRSAAHQQSHQSYSSSGFGLVLSKASALVAPLRNSKGLLGGLGSIVNIKLLLLPVILLLLGGAYFFFNKAEVSIFIEPRILENNAEIIADPKVSSIDEEKKIIPGKIIETTVDGTGKAQATGKKQIGDPAKGKVVVYNLTSSKVSLSQGTVLTSSEGLKFALDSSVQIASQSSSIGADFTTVIKPGKSDAAGVTAKAIGSEGNLPANNDLAVASYQKSQVIARVEEAFSGGTSKNVTIVTADDQKKLQAKVLDDLRGQAQDDLKSKQSGDQKVISEALDIVDSKYKFNKQAGDQANEFSLTATVKFKGTAYSDTDLKTVVSKLVQTNVPDGFGLSPADMETQADVSKVEKDGRLIFKAKFKAKLMPKFDLEALKAKMKGQTVEEVASQLKTLDSVIGSEIKLSPSLPSPFSRLPYLDKNIAISVSPK